MKWPCVTRALYELAIESRDVEHETAALVRRQLLDMTMEHAAALTSRDKLYADLLDKYHALREKGYHFVDPQSFSPVLSPLEALGPETKAALKTMSIGLPPANRRAQEASALAMHADNIPDAQIAAAVRRGEPVLQRNH